MPEYLLQIFKQPANTERVNQISLCKNYSLWSPEVNKTSIQFFLKIFVGARETFLAIKKNYNRV